MGLRKQDRAHNTCNLPKFPTRQPAGVRCRWGHRWDLLLRQRLSTPTAQAADLEHSHVNRSERGHGAGGNRRLGGESLRDDVASETGRMLLLSQRRLAIEALRKR